MIMVRGARFTVCDLDGEHFSEVLQIITYRVERAPSRQLRVHLRDGRDALEIGCGQGATKADFAFLDGGSRTLPHKSRLQSTKINNLIKRINT